MKTNSQLLRREMLEFPFPLSLTRGHLWEWLMVSKIKTSALREFSIEHRLYNSQINKIDWWLRG